MFFEDCRIILCKLKVGPKQYGAYVVFLLVLSFQIFPAVWKEGIERYGGQVVEVLDKNTTHIITAVGLEETGKWLNDNVKRVVEKDKNGKRVMYDTTIHTEQWLIQSLGRKEKLAKSEFKLTRNGVVSANSSSLSPAKLGSPLHKNAGDGMMPKISAFWANNHFGIQTNANSNQRQPLPPAQEQVAQFQRAESLGVDLVKGIDRPVPPCKCGLPCRRKESLNGSNGNYGRIFFCCANPENHFIGKPKCKFFEWADQPPRAALVDHYDKHGYDYKKYMKLDYEEWEPVYGAVLTPEKKSEIPGSPPSNTKAPDSPARQTIRTGSTWQEDRSVSLVYANEASIHEICKCTICQETMVDPMSTECHHNFCKICIEKWMTTKAACPQCRKEVSKLLEPDHTLVRILGELEVFCVSRSKGCSWMGCRSNLDDHLAKCEYLGCSSTEEGKHEVGKKKKRDWNKPPSPFDKYSPKKARTDNVIINDTDKVEINKMYSLPPASFEDSNSLADSMGSLEAFRQSRVFTNQSPPRAEDLDNVKADNYADYDPKGAELEGVAEVTPWLEKNRHKWAAANPNAYEYRAENNVNKELCDELKRIAASHEALRDQWRAKGYTQAAAAISRHPVKITSAEQARAIRGVGARIEEKIKEFLAFGATRKTRLKDDEQKAREEMGMVHGVGPSVLDKLWTKGVKSVKDMRLNQHLLTETQKIGLRYVEEFKQRIPREEVAAIEAIIQEVALELDSGLVLATCGSYRRGKASCGDIDILITHERFAKPLEGLLPSLVKRLEEKGIITDSLTMSEKDGKWMGVCQLNKDSLHRRLDFRIIARESWPFALMYFTGSAHFNRSLRHWAGKIGLSLSEHALVKRPTEKHVKDMHKKGQKIKCATEEDVFHALQVSSYLLSCHIQNHLLIP